MSTFFNLYSHASFALEFMASNIRGLVRDNSDSLTIWGDITLVWDEDKGLLYKTNSEEIDVNRPEDLYRVLYELYNMGFISAK